MSIILIWSFYHHFSRKKQQIVNGITCFLSVQARPENVVPKSTPTIILWSYRTGVRNEDDILRCSAVLNELDPKDCCEA